MSTTFGDIRSILHGEPGEEAWWSLCWAIREYDGEVLMAEVVLPYCLGVLQSWPGEVARAAPGDWKRALLRNQGPPALTLCTHVTLQNVVIRPNEAASLAASPYLT